jgi:alkanesulfonate monooxygenase SsuD/methylene tetrahydromethanopterin reductase-like flavin-dependent oxidoreductase (luciferase family)
MNIRPVQKPRPPIWMAANSDPAVKRAARMADAWFVNPHATSDTIGRQMAIYRAELDAAGKGAPRELPVIKEVYCAKDRSRYFASRWGPAISRAVARRPRNPSRSG